MPLKDYPRAKRFLNEEGEDESDLNAIVQAVKINQITDDLEDLESFVKSNDSENFFKELNTILKLSDDGISTTTSFNAPVPSTTQNIQQSVSEPRQQSFTDNIQARTTERIGPLFTSPESQIQASKNNFNEVVAVSFVTLSLVIIWRLDVIGLDLFQCLTLGIGLSIVVPLIGSEFSTKNEEFEIWKLISTVAWVAMILSMINGVKFDKTDSHIAMIIFSGAISEMFVAGFLFIICASIWLSPITDFDSVRGLRNLSSPISILIFAVLIILLQLSNVDTR